MTATGKPQKLLPAMTCIRQANNQSYDAVNWVRKSIQSVHAARLMSIFCVKFDISANFYGKYSAPFSQADRGFGHAEEGVRLELCVFCLRGFWFMLSRPEVNRTSRSSSASLRKNCASFRMAGKNAHFPACAAAPRIIKHQRAARDNRSVTDR